MLSVDYRPVADRPKPEAVSPERAAELLDVSVETIRRHIQAGKLPALRVGHQYRILLSELKRAYQQSSTAHTS